MITGIKSVKNNSDPKIARTRLEQKGNYSEEKIKYKENLSNTSDPSSLISQVPEKIDIQNLTNIEEIKDFYDYTENCLHLISKMVMPKLEEIENIRIDLPLKLLKKKIAIFDLDETLIHCELKNGQKGKEFVNIKLANGQKVRVSQDSIISYFNRLGLISDLIWVLPFPRL